MEQLIPAFFGLVVGAFLASLGFLYKRRLENLSRMNEALFQLLELYGAVRVALPVSIEQSFEWYFSVAQEVFPDEPIAEYKNGMREKLLPVIVEASNRVSAPGDSDLLAEYKAAVSKLGSLNPVLAYRLSANRSLKNSISQVDEYHRNVRELLGGLNDEEKKGVELGIEILRKRVSTVVIDELRKDILFLSFQCSLYTQFLLVKSLYFRKEKTMEELMKEEYRWFLLELKGKGATTL